MNRPKGERVAPQRASGFPHSNQRAEEQGITVEFSRPSSPQDNGSHKRIYKDLKAECTRPPSINLATQQRRFFYWQHTYNYECPYEALEQQLPSEFYQPSPRRLNEHDTPLLNPKDYEVKTVSVSRLKSGAEKRALVSIVIIDVGADHAGGTGRRGQYLWLPCAQRKCRQAAVWKKA